MRLCDAIVVAVISTSLGLSPAQAQSRDGLRPARDQALVQPLTPPRTRAANPCLQYGPGFGLIEGTSTCVKIGGSVGIGGSVNSNTIGR